MMFQAIAAARTIAEQAVAKGKAKDRMQAKRMKPAAGCTLMLAVVLLAACSNQGPPEIGSKGLACVDDSHACIAERSGALNTLMADKQRTWVRQPAPAAAYASGVRLFAFKQKKRELTCDELSAGRREADAGPGVLRGADGRSLTTAQVARGVMLAQEVSRELSAEQRRRCKV